MERAFKSPSDLQYGAAAKRAPQSAISAPYVDNRPRTLVQRELAAAIESSPHIAAQRQRLSGMFGNLAQPGGKSVSEVVGRKGRFDPIGSKLRHGPGALPRRTIQRRIAVDVKPMVEMREDMPVLKVAAQLKNFLAGKLGDSDVRELTESLDVSDMTQGEPLYIVGHGGIGELYGLKPDQLLRMLNHPTRGLPEGPREIVILACNAGTREEDQPPPSSLVDKLKLGLRHPNVKVVGARGYTFGAPTTAETGRNRVLKPVLWTPTEHVDMDDLKLDPLGNVGIDQDMLEAIKSHGHEPERGATTLRSAFASTKEFEEYVKPFFERKAKVEERLRSAVEQAKPEDEGELGADFTNVVAKLRENEDFREAVVEQEKLYDEYGFFYPKNTQYDEQTSIGKEAALNDTTSRALFLGSVSLSERLELLKESKPQAYETLQHALAEDLEKVRTAVQELLKELNGMSRNSKQDGILERLTQAALPSLQAMDEMEEKYQAIRTANGELLGTPNFPSWGSSPKTLLLDKVRVATVGAMNKLKLTEILKLFE